VFARHRRASARRCCCGSTLGEEIDRFSLEVVHGASDLDGVGRIALAQHLTSAADVALPGVFSATGLRVRTVTLLPPMPSTRRSLFVESRMSTRCYERSPMGRRDVLRGTRHVERAEGRAASSRSRGGYQAQLGEVARAWAGDLRQSLCDANQRGNQSSQSIGRICRTPMPMRRTQFVPGSVS
jgi:hypothetical protein